MKHRPKSHELTKKQIEVLDKKSRIHGYNSVEETKLGAIRHLKKFEPMETFYHNMKPSTLEILGQRRGKLYVAYLLGRTSFQTVWACQCDCGMWNYKLKTQLDSGRALHCGCMTRSLVVKHGHCTDYRPSKEYNLWRGLKSRGGLPKSKTFVQWLRERK